jgi:hypothetical protein
MSACEFNIPFSGTPDVVYNKAKSVIESQGGTFDGDINAGSFDVTVFGNRIAGDYSVNGQNLSLIIHTKPFLIPCNMIESVLVKQIS